MIFKRLFSLITRGFLLILTLFLTWWGIWQLPIVQTAAGGWLSSRLEEAGVDSCVERISFDWRGRWVLKGVQSHQGGHPLSANEIRLVFGISSLWDLSRGHLAASGITLQGLQVDGTPWEWCEGTEWAGWIAPSQERWLWGIEQKGGLLGSGQLLWAEDRWELEAEVEWPEAPWALASTRFCAPRGHLIASGSQQAWQLEAAFSTEGVALSPADRVEGKIDLRLEGKGSTWQGLLEGGGFWGAGLGEHEEQSERWSLQGQMRGDAHGWSLHRAQIELPYARVSAKASFGAQWQGNLSFESEQMHDWALLREHWLQKSGLSLPGIQEKVLSLKGKALLELDWLGTPKDCCLGLKLELGAAQWGDLQIEQWKGKVRGVLKENDWSTFLWSCTGKGRATQVIWRRSRVDQLAWSWQPTDLGLQGALAGAGLCGGRLQLSSQWTATPDRIVIDELVGNLFGQPFASQAPIAVEAQGDGWLNCSGIQIPSLQLDWGKGSITGWVALNQKRWQGQLQGTQTPLEWVGLLVGPLECTGLGNLSLLVGGDATDPYWHAELEAPEATVLLGPLSGCCSASLTLDGASSSLDIGGSVRISQAQLGLGPLGNGHLPGFDLEWTQQTAERLTKSPYRVRYRIDLHTDGKALCRAGPLETQWEGSLLLQGVNQTPSLSGCLYLQPTQIEALGIPFHLQGGALTVKGCTPDQIFLDLHAETDLPEGIARIDWSGSAQEPRLSIFSESAHNTTELLQQLATLAQARDQPEMAKQLNRALQWLPRANPEAIERLRKEVGLHRLEIDQGMNEGEILQLTLGAQLTERILVQLHQNLGADMSGFSIETGEGFSTVNGRCYALQSGTTLLPAGRVALRWKMHY